MKNDDIQIYVVAHKNLKTKYKDRRIIAVGNKQNEIKADFYDSKMDNISNKNESFCELTALYWIVKNTNDEIVGLEHYRRLFCKWYSFIWPKPISKKYIYKQMKKYDCILPNKSRTRVNLRDAYIGNHIESDYVECEKIIFEKYPDYIDSLNKVNNSKWISYYNMFIMKKELLDKYSNWLFDILFELEKRIVVDDRDSFQKRVFGFLSEYLLNVWIINNNIKVKHCYVYMNKECSLKRRLLSNIKHFLRR